MNGLHLFIDNSNIFIEAQRVARNVYFYDDDMIPRMRVNYTKLLELVRNGRTLADAKLVGSKPPDHGDLWNRLRTLGIDVNTFWKSPGGNEKEVDTELVNLIRDALEDNPKPGTIALIAGDRDYYTTIERCIKKGWAVEIYFWEQASSDIKQLSGTSFISLNQYFEQITYLEKPKS